MAGDSILVYTTETPLTAQQTVNELLDNDAE